MDLLDMAGAFVIAVLGFGSLTGMIKYAFERNQLLMQIESLKSQIKAKPVVVPSTNDEILAMHHKCMEELQQAYLALKVAYIAETGRIEGGGFMKLVDFGRLHNTEAEIINSDHMDWMQQNIPIWRN